MREAPGVPLAARIPFFIGGMALVLIALDSAVRTFVLPRGALVPVSRLVFGLVRMPFKGLTRLARTYERRDRVMAPYAPRSSDRSFSARVGSPAPRPRP